MSFAEWKKKTKLLKPVGWITKQEAEQACQAAYKAGERDGRKQEAEACRRTIALLTKP